MFPENDFKKNKRLSKMFGNISLKVCEIIYLCRLHLEMEKEPLDKLEITAAKLFIPLKLQQSKTVHSYLFRKAELD